MADIFVAERIVGGRTTELVARKRLRRDLLDDAVMVGMFDDEIQLGRRCSHPNLVATLDSGSELERPFAVLEYVDGLDLRRARELLLARGERFTRAQAVHVAMEVCAGLAHLHTLTDASGVRLGVVHRDVTPANVLLGVSGSVKLCDCGLAKSGLQRTRTDAGLIKGKFSYLSPEAALEQPIDERADVFAVGVMLWEMLAMRRLFHAPTDYDTLKLVQATEVPSLAAQSSDVDPVLAEIVTKALARDPERRFRSASALRDALAAYADWQELACDLGALVERLKPRDFDRASHAAF
jgi:serine/threonine-protein kinase